MDLERSANWNENDRTRSLPRKTSKVRSSREDLVNRWFLLHWGDESDFGWVSGFFQKGHLINAVLRLKGQGLNHLEQFPAGAEQKGAFNSWTNTKYHTSLRGEVSQGCKHQLFSSFASQRNEFLSNSNLVPWCLPKPSVNSLEFSASLGNANRAAGRGECGGRMLLSSFRDLGRQS